MSNIRLLIKLGFKGRLSNFRVRAIYVEILYILNGFKLELKIKSGKLKKWGSFIIEGLIKTFYRSIYLKRIDFYKLKINAILK